MPTKSKAKSTPNLNLRFEITNKTKGKLPRLPFAKVKDAVLGKGYELSLVFVDNAESQKLNRIYRNKNKPTNVLSFSLSPKSGEIVMNPAKAKSEAKDFGMSYAKCIGYLYIHGLLHLQGHEHGTKMERMEAQLLKRFEF